MHAVFKGIFLPYLIIRLDIHYLKPVHYSDVKFADRLIEFGRISRGHYHPSLRYLMASEHLVLQELEHRGRKRFGDTVYLVKEKDAFLNARLPHSLIYGRDYLAHGIFGHVIFKPFIFLMLYEGKAYRRLPCVMRHGV